MKFKSVMLLGVAVACGLVAMLGVQQVMSGPSDTGEEPEDAQVLVATAEILAFAPLDESNTTFKTMPVKDVPEGAILSREECLERTLKFGVVENDIILISKLTEKNHKPSKEIPSGMRLVTVKVNQTKTHSGLVRPGDFVDIILTYRFSEQNMRPIQRALVILQNVKVFATDNRRRVVEQEGSDIKAKNMSLVVTPDDANLLILAESKGQLTMALRVEGEPIQKKIKSYDERDLENLLADKSAGPKNDDGEDDGEPSFVPNYGAFLNGDPMTAPLDLNANKQPEQKTWKITIFDGTVPRTEEVNLPEDDKQSSNRDADGNSNSTERGSNNSESKQPAKNPAASNEDSRSPRKNADRPKQSQPTTATAL